MPRLIAISLIACACRAAPDARVSSSPIDGVVFETVELTTRSESIRLPGTIGLAPEAETVVAAPVAGRLVERPALGARLASGEVAATLEVAAPEPPAKPARTTPEPRGSAELERLTKLAKLGLVAWARVSEARRAAPPPAPTPTPATSPRALRRLEASGSGVVVDLPAPVGSELAPGAVVARLVDPAQLEIRASVAEPHLDRIRPGLEARVSLIARPELPPLPARVIRVATHADRRARRLDVTLAPSAPVLDLRPGLGCVIELELAPHPALRVPRGALLLRDGETVAVVRRRGGTPIEIRSVRARPLGEGLVEIIAGVEAGEQIAVRGAGLLIAPPHAEPRSGGRAWLLAPRGRGLAVAAALPADALAPPARSPSLVELDVLGLGDAGVATADALERLDAGAALPPGWGAARAGERFAARVYRPDSDSGTVVDALELRDPDAAHELYARARAVDPRVTLTGRAPPPATAPALPVAAGAVLLLLATGSIRAALLLAGAAACLGPWPASSHGAVATPAHAVAATVVALTLVQVLERAAAEAASSWHTLTAALGRATLIALPAAAAALAVTVTPASEARVLALGLMLAAAAGAALLATLYLVPTAGSFVAAPVERLPIPLLAVVALAAAGVLVQVSLPRASVLSFPVTGGPLLEPHLLERGLRSAARAALASGATEAVAVADDRGDLHLVVDSPWPETTAAALLGAAPPGLGLGSTRSPPAVVTEPDPITHGELDEAAARLAATLARGPARIGRRLVRLRDPSAASLLPIPTRDGRLLFHGEVTGPTETTGELTPPPVAAPARLDAERPTGPEVRYAAAAGLVLLVTAIARPLDLRRRGASPRITWSQARGPTMRAASAGLAATVATAFGLAAATTAALLAAAFAIALIAAVAASYGPLPRRPSSATRRLPAVPG